MCTGVEVALAISATAAAASTGVAVANYEAAQDAAGAQRNLANDQRAALKASQDAATAQAAAQESTGSAFGFTDRTSKTIQTGFGFGTAPAGSPNSGRSQITGMS